MEIKILVEIKIVIETFLFVLSFEMIENINLPSLKLKLWITRNK